VVTYSTNIEERVLSPDKEAVLRSALDGLYEPGYFDVEANQPIAEAELQERFFWYRTRYMPWVLSVTALDGAQVLEIGSGTGSSGVAMAERGAFVDCIDLNEAALGMARTRAELFGVAGRMSSTVANATDIDTVAPRSTYDLVLYPAALEHMTFEERITTVSKAWAMVRPGGFLGICDTPNRLWFHDWHTTFVEFFLWLPDDVALAYADRSPRVGFSEEFSKADDDAAAERLARWGRGVSYHDLEIATGDKVEDLESFGEWEFRRNAQPEWAKWYLESKEGRFHLLLREIAPHVPAAFLEQELAVLIRRP
jgi:ubiquinone/menaquinone biosynthesis C-methylase UbiE